jgi:hypothetical protein
MVKIKYMELNEKEKSYEHSIRVPVKMGSHRMFVRLIINEKKTPVTKTIRPKDLVEVVLKKCNMKKYSSKTYSVFESFKGIERFLDQDEDIIEIMKYWNHFFDEHNEYPHNLSKQPFIEFVIRKLHSVEKGIVVHESHNKINQISKKNINNNLEESNKINPNKFAKSKSQNLNITSPLAISTNITESKNLKRKVCENENSIKKFFQIKEIIHLFDYKSISRKNSLKSLNSIISHTANLKDNLFEKLSNNNKQLVEMIQYKKQRCEYQKYFIDGYIENTKLVDSLVY